MIRPDGPGGMFVIYTGYYIKYEEIINERERAVIFISARPPCPYEFFNTITLRPYEFFSTTPGLAPVCSPPDMTRIPFTITSETPSA